MSLADQITNHAPWNADDTVELYCTGAEVNALRDELLELRRLRAAAGDMRGLLADLVDADPCWFDHHGGCQAHGYLSLEPGEACPHQFAKELLARADQHTEECHG